MKLFPSKSKFFLQISTVLLLLMSIISCGGSSDKKDTPLSITQDSLLIYGYEGSKSYPTAKINVVLSEAAYDKIKKNLQSAKHAYFYLEQSSDFISDIAIEISNSRYASITLTAFQPYIYFPKGEYNSTVKIIGCYDSQCKEKIGEDSLDITYQVISRPSISTRDLEVKLNEEALVEIDFHDLDVSADSVAFDVTYGSNSVVEWLSTDYAINGDKISLKFNASEASCGVHHAAVKISHTGAQGLKTSYDLNVKYIANSGEVTIKQAIPQVHHVGKPIQMTLFGCGMQNLTTETLASVIPGLEIQSVTPISSFKTKVTAKARDSVGLIEVSLDSSSESEKITLNIKEQSNFESLEIIDIQADKVDRLLSFYDAHRDQIYSRDFRNYWHVLTYEDGVWQEKALNMQADSLVLTNDGKYLFSRTGRDISILDANDYSLVNTIVNTGHENINQLYSNEIVSLSKDSRDLFSLLVTNIDTGETSRRPVGTFKGSVRTSADKSIYRFVGTGSYTSSYEEPKPIATYDRTLDSFTEREIPIPSTVSYIRFKLNFHGDRTLVVYQDNKKPSGQANSIKVFNEDYTNSVDIEITDSYKNLPEETLINKEGTLVYVLECSSGTCVVNEAEISMGDTGLENTNFRQIATFDEDGGSGYEFSPSMLLSADENTLYVGMDEIIAIPLN